MPRRLSVLIFLNIAVIAAVLVTAVGLLTNRMAPEWDMKCYLDMATNGVIGNSHLVSPFAYSPAAPLIARGIAHLLNLSAGTAFHICGYLACAAFVVCCFYFARSMGASSSAAALSATALAINFQVVKWTLFAGTMVDIYVYPLILLAFWLMIRRRFYLCLFVSGVGLFFKEFMLLPLVTQAAAVVIKNWQNRLVMGKAQKAPPKQWLKNLIKPLALTVLVLVTCFLLPRLLIHVARAVKDYAGVAPIDPFQNPASLRRLYSFPANVRRDFNIAFAYLTWWLPVLLLIDAKRLQLVWTRLRPYGLVCALYLGFHFLLVMYGGTNLDIFATYSLPVLVMVIAVLLNEGGVRLWEKMLMLLIVILFNRIWMHIPLPQDNLRAYLNFYGGYNDLITRRSLFRMAELLTYVVGFWALRALITRGGREIHQRAEAATTLANSASGTSGISNS